MNLPFAEKLKNHWGNAAASSYTFLTQAAEHAPLPVYRDVAAEMLGGYGEPIPEPEIPDDFSWHTTVEGQPHIARVFEDFRVLWIPQYGGGGEWIERYKLLIEIHPEQIDRLPKSFDDLDPFLGGWTTGYRARLQVADSNWINTITTPICFETTPGESFAEAEFEISAQHLDYAQLKFLLTSETGHFVESVEADIFAIIPEGWREQHRPKG